MVVKENNGRTEINLGRSSADFINGLNQKLITNRNIRHKEVNTLTEIIGVSENYYMMHENKEVPSLAAFVIYDSDCCGCNPVLKIMEEQVPKGMCYHSLIQSVQSEINIDKAKNSGAIIDYRDNEYFSELD